MPRGNSCQDCNMPTLSLQGNGSMLKKDKNIWNQRLRKAREELGFSLSQAVSLLYEQHKIRLDKSHLAKIERADISCSVEKFKALCDIYSADPRWVLDWKE